VTTKALARDMETTSPDPIARRHLPKGRGDEGREAGERRDRIARQPDDQTVAVSPHEHRLARADRHLVEDLPHARLGQDLSDEVVLAHGDPAGDEQDVPRQPGANRLAQAVTCVGRDAEVAAFQAELS
jgi:hypothetical protein